MDTIANLKLATASKWSWLLSCWKQRERVLELLSSLSDPAKDNELSHLRLEKLAVDNNLALAKKEIAALVKQKEELATQSQESLNDAIQGLTSERGELSHKLKSVEEKLSEQVRFTDELILEHEATVKSLKQQMQAVQSDSKRDKSHLLQIEADALKGKLQSLEKDHQLSKDGNRALLRFIHTAHRLSVKFDPDSIRGALQRAQST